MRVMGDIVNYVDETYECYCDLMDESYDHHFCTWMMSHWLCQFGQEGDATLNIFFKKGKRLHNHGTLDGNQHEQDKMSVTSGMNFANESRGCYSELCG